LFIFARVPWSFSGDKIKTMIFYLAKAEYTYTISHYLKLHESDLKSHLKLLSYEDLFKLRATVGGTYIFSDIERLNPDNAKTACQIWTELAAYLGPSRLLNHPTRSMKRYELLRGLYQRDVNAFNVYRLTECRTPERFPVFIRDENEHGQIHSGLLKNSEELEKAIEKMLRDGAVRDNKLIVEFCGASDARGAYRKYEAFFIGGQILPQHIKYSSDWIVRLSEPHLKKCDEELIYIHENPHEKFLADIFRYARIDYGRIDYDVLDGRPQIWEINTNPTLLLLGGRPPLCPESEKIIGTAFLKALLSLDGREDPAQRRIPIQLGPPSQPVHKRLLRKYFRPL